MCNDQGGKDEADDAGLASGDENAVLAVATAKVEYQVPGDVAEQMKGIFERVRGGGRGVHVALDIRLIHS